MPARAGSLALAKDKEDGSWWLVKVTKTVKGVIVDAETEIGGVYREDGVYVAVDPMVACRIGDSNPVYVIPGALADVVAIQRDFRPGFSWPTLEDAQRTLAGYFYKTEEWNINGAKMVTETPKVPDYVAGEPAAPTTEPARTAGSDSGPVPTPAPPVNGNPKPNVTEFTVSVRRVVQVKQFEPCEVALSATVTPDPAFSVARNIDRVEGMLQAKVDKYLQAWVDESR